MARWLRLSGSFTRRSARQVQHAADMSRTTLLLATALVTFAGCATDGGSSDTSTGGKADGQLTRVTFSEDFSETADGAITAGSPIRIKYDLDRLPDCRGETNGSDVWGATGYASFDGGEPTTFAVSRLTGGRTVELEAELDVPSTAHRVQLWFSSSNRWGCIAYDSNDSANYEFEVEQRSDSAVLSFDADYSESQSGAVVAGGQVVVHYDPSRLSQCAGATGGMAAWSVTGYYKVDSGATKQILVTRAEGPDLVSSDPSITVPHGRKLEVWFDTTSRWGCHAYDSNSGANYVYEIE